MRINAVAPAVSLATLGSSVTALVRVALVNTDTVVLPGIFRANSIYICGRE